MTDPFRGQVSDDHAAFGTAKGTGTAPHRPLVTGRSLVEVPLNILSFTGVLGLPPRAFCRGLVSTDWLVMETAHQVPSGFNRMVPFGIFTTTVSPSAVTSSPAGFCPFFQGTITVVNVPVPRMRRMSCRSSNFRPWAL